MDANAVKSYSLDIVEKDKDAQEKVVGTCEGGTKKIVYSRATDDASTPKAPDAKPTGAASKH